MQRFAYIIASAVLAAVVFQPLSAAARDRYDLGPRPPGQFDFYALSLTWVPEFCATHRDPNECGRGEGFALHGLWPESVGGHPSGCSREPLPDDVRASFQDIFASPGLIDHEWQVHGTCSGLGPLGFFQTTSSVLDSVVVPPDLAQERSLDATDAASVRDEMIAANPGLSPESIVLVCEGRRIEEMHVCVGRDGTPRACVAWERSEDNCR